MHTLQEKVCGTGRGDLRRLGVVDRTVECGSKGTVSISVSERRRRGLFDSWDRTGGSWCVIQRRISNGDLKLFDRTFTESTRVNPLISIGNDIANSGVVLGTTRSR